jgi:two-component system, OmpR family, sensor histidine kinase MtrB
VTDLSEVVVVDDSPNEERTKLRSRLRLRARIIVSFTAGSMVMAFMLAATTYGVTRQSTLNQREDTATQQAITNAQFTQQILIGQDVEDEQITERLENLASTADSAPLVLDEEGSWRTGGNADPADVPEALIASVRTSGRPFRMREDSAGRSLLVIGIPMPLASQFYFEVVPLEDIESALQTLWLTLLAAGILTSVAGAGFGVWVSTRVLRPITEVSVAAQAIAGGRLDTRLDPRNDPDLDVIVASFNDMAEALQDRIDREARFASDVSHELRSPLMTLRASIDVMRGRRDQLPARSQAALDLLIHDVDRFENLIEDLLEISRLDAGAADMWLEPTVLADLVRNSIEYHSYDVAVIVDDDAQDLIVEADKRRMSQVLANLLANAENHAEGVSAIRIKNAGADHVRILVEDTGKGIPDADKDLVFERFARGTTAGKRGSGRGTGLGLALVAEHVQLHHGSVWVEDRSDGVSGSCFVIELPTVEL